MYMFAMKNGHNYNHYNRNGGTLNKTLYNHTEPANLSGSVMKMFLNISLKLEEVSAFLTYFMTIYIISIVALRVFKVLFKSVQIPMERGRFRGIARFRQYWQAHGVNPYGVNGGVVRAPLGNFNGAEAAPPPGIRQISRRQQQLLLQESHHHPHRRVARGSTGLERRRGFEINHRLHPYNRSQLGAMAENHNPCPYSLSRNNNNPARSAVVRTSNYRRARIVRD